MEKLLANEIREALKSHIGHAHYLSEFTFYGNGTIADLLDVTDEIIGYEIKSNSDTYTRLPRQIQGYNSVCKRVYMVVGEKKRNSVLKHAPSFYGILIARRLESGLVEFEEIREAQDNPYWTYKALLYWWPSDLLKRYAKSLKGLLEEYGGKKTPINRLNKSTLIDKVLCHAEPSEIEAETLKYLQSPELEERRRLNTEINQSNRNQDAFNRQREIDHRVSNFKYITMDFKDLEAMPNRRQMARLQGLTQLYLPLSLDYNFKGIHNGRFKFNNSTGKIDFQLKGPNGFIDGFTIPNCIQNLTFVKVLEKGLKEDLSLAKLSVLIKESVQ